MKHTFSVLNESGTEIPYYTWEVKNPRAVAVFVHGLKSHAGWFLDAGAAFAKRGIRVYAFDRRGSGRSGEQRGYVDDYHRWLDDIDAMVRLAAEGRGDDRPHLIGHCFGAKLSLGYVLAHPGSISSLSLIAPPQFALKTNIHAISKLRLIMALLLRRNANIEVPVSDDMFTKDSKKNEFIKNDELRLQSMTPIFCAEIARLDRWINKHLESIRVPTLTLLAAHDDVVDNDRVLAKLVTRLGCRRKAVDIYDCYHHLLFEPYADQVVDRIVQWITAPGVAI